MKTILPFLLVFLFPLTQIFSQRIIEGTVTDQDGIPLIGASVVVNGTAIGAITDVDGKYRLEAPENAESISISYVGYESVTRIIGEDSIINFALAIGIILDEAIVTALGISRTKKSLGYAAQEVKGENLSFSRETNIVSSLAGKIAGVQVINSSGAGIGGSARIRIRGSNGLQGGQPLFVVDGTPISNNNFSNWYSGTDYGNLSQDINPDDIESITVLKGPSATALYGNRASNGVIMVTTKKGKAQDGLGISINSSTTFEEVYILPDYQNEYAGGYDGTFPEYFDPKNGETYKGLEYYADESWGPPIDGSTMYRPWWSWIPGDDYGKQIPLVANPNNVRDFFNTGIKYNNNIAISGGNELATFRLSFSNVNHKGVIPNSSLIENNLSVNASLQLSEKLSVRTNINFANNKGRARPEFGGSLSNPTGSFNQWFQRQLDMDKLREYKNPDGSFRSWNLRSPYNPIPLFWDNPFVSVFENFSTDGRDRYFGNVTLHYKFNDHLSLEAAARRDDYNQRIEDRTASGTRNLDRYSEFVVDGREDNFDFLFKYDNNFGDFTLDGNLGGAMRENTYHSNFAATVGGLSAPNLFTLEASVDRPNLNNFISEKKVRSIYGAINLGYKNFFYLGGTLRNDWSSALPDANNSFLYPSVNTSFVFTELFNSGLLSFGKIRASFAQVGSDTNPYQTRPRFDTGTSYGTISSFEIPNTLLNENLEPSLSSSYEFGAELRFIKSRFGFDFTWYREDNKNQILSIQVPGSSGYRNAIINAGNIRDKGMELSLIARPITSNDFSWDITVNVAKNESKIIELADGIDNRILEGGGQWTLNAPVGGEWGTQRGVAFKRIDGMRVLREDGSFVTERDQDLGSMLPDYTGGVINSIRFKGIEFTSFFDVQIGGLLWSGTKLFNGYSGLSTETAGMNDRGAKVRDPIAEGGGYKVDGVLETGEAYTTYVNPERHFKQLWNIDEAWNYDATYVKLRELRVGYDIPANLLKKFHVQRLNISIIAQNVWMIHSKVTGLDPSELSPGSNPYISGEEGTLPSIRSVGINLRVGF